jgi:hypothetical protein
MRLSPVVLSLAACATGSHLDHSGDVDAAAGDSKGASDGPGNTQHPDASPQGAIAKLLITEVVLGPAGHEFVEIVNPSSTMTVDLSTYYLSDNGNYFKLPVAVPAVTGGDFIINFPHGATLAPHGVATIALDTVANFSAAYATTPTYSIGDSTVTIITQMSPTITDAGEIVVLFQWDGSSPLVKDVDMVLVGVPTTGNSFVAKSGYTQSSGTYQTDAQSMPLQASAAGSGKSTKRIALDSGHQTATGGGNGLDGDDETSEVTTATWDTTATYSAPTPGQVPTALLQ